jgi:hypothetical protein
MYDGATFPKTCKQHLVGQTTKSIGSGLVEFVWSKAQCWQQQRFQDKLSDICVAGHQSLVVSTLKLTTKQPSGATRQKCQVAERATNQGGISLLAGCDSFWHK